TLRPLAVLSPAAGDKQTRPGNMGYMGRTSYPMSRPFQARNITMSSGFEKDVGHPTGEQSIKKCKLVDTTVWLRPANGRVYVTPFRTAAGTQRLWPIAFMRLADLKLVPDHYSSCNEAGWFNGNATNCSVTQNAAPFVMYVSPASHASTALSIGSTE